MHVSNVVLSGTEGQDWRYYFLLCMDYWIQTVPSFPVIAEIAQGYLSLALNKSYLSAEEARRLKHTLEHASWQHEAGDNSTSVVVDFGRALTSRDMVRAHDLAQKFDDLATIDDLIVSDGQRS